LASQRIDSTKIDAAGFEFLDTELDPALARIFN
jgi:hypothetical protein